MLGFSALDAAALAATGELDVTVAVTGVQGTGAVGTVVVAAAANVPVTGVEATGQTGTVVVTANAEYLEWLAEGNEPLPADEPSE